MLNAVVCCLLNWPTGTMKLEIKTLPRKGCAVHQIKCRASAYWRALGLCQNGAVEWCPSHVDIIPYTKCGNSLFLVMNKLILIDWPRRGRRQVIMAVKGFLGDKKVWKAEDWLDSGIGILEEIRLQFGIENLWVAKLRCLKRKLGTAAILKIWLAELEVTAPNISSYFVSAG